MTFEERGEQAGGKRDTTQLERSRHFSYFQVPVKKRSISTSKQSCLLMMCALATGNNYENATLFTWCTTPLEPSSCFLSLLLYLILFYSVINSHSILSPSTLHTLLKLLSLFWEFWRRSHLAKRQDNLACCVMCFLVTEINCEVAARFNWCIAQLERSACEAAGAALLPTGFISLLSSSPWIFQCFFSLGQSRVLVMCLLPTGIN